jgi:hypothetical protein
VTIIIIIVLISSILIVPTFSENSTVYAIGKLMVPHFPKPEIKLHTDFPKPEINPDSDFPKPEINPDSVGKNIKLSKDPLLQKILEPKFKESISNKIEKIKFKGELQLNTDIVTTNLYSSNDMIFKSLIDFVRPFHHFLLGLIPIGI